MAKHRRKRHNEGGDVDMTPMIDVVFQLIIFFIVTIKMEETANEDIELPIARQSPTVEELPPRTIVVEVDRRGRFSLAGTPLSKSQLKGIIEQRYARLGQYPVMIRADGRAKHKAVRQVMDLCAAVGIWRVDFAAIKKYSDEQ
jgi:biopolymer transport protein ExbD